MTTSNRGQKRRLGAALLAFFILLSGKFLQAAPLPTVTSEVELLQDDSGVGFLPISDFQLGEI